MEPQSLTCEATLAKTLEVLEKTEKENASLKVTIQGLEAQLQQKNKELSRLKRDMDEVKYVNDQWDKDYREHDEAFRRYRDDAQRAQMEYQSLVANLKENKEQLSEEIRDLQYQLDKSRKELGIMKQRMHALEQQVATSRGYDQTAYQKRIQELESEIAFLQQQLKTYQEDFEAERRDRERLSEEKQSSALRFEAEITSLKLQLDRCRNELVHYTTESTRLAQQLRLKNQYEEDQFKKHLESQGYIPRSPSGRLPPLDPFVEIDPTHYQGHSTTTGGPQVPYGVGASQRTLRGHPLLARSAEELTKSAPTTAEQRMKDNSPPTVQRKSHPPSPTYMNLPDQPPSHPPRPASANATSNRPNGGGYIMQNGHIANGGIVGSQQYLQQPQTNNMVNGTSTLAPYANGYTNGYTVNGAAHYVDGDGPNVGGYAYPQNFQQLVVGNQPQVIPKVESKGKYACPRCARRFNNKADCSDHKARCMS